MNHEIFQISVLAILILFVVVLVDAFATVIVSFVIRPEFSLILKESLSLFAL